MASQRELSTATNAVACGTTSVPTSTSSHTIYVTFKPQPGRPFNNENLSHEYRSVGACSGLLDGSARERLETMYGLYQVVKHRYDRLYWESDQWETESESESESKSESDHEDLQSRVQRFREKFDSFKPEWQNRQGKLWKKAAWIRDEHRPDGPIMPTETELVILTEEEFNTRFPSTPSGCFEVIRDYPASKPGEVVMGFEENPSQQGEVVMDLDEKPSQQGEVVMDDDQISWISVSHPDVEM